MSRVAHPEIILARRRRLQISPNKDLHTQPHSRTVSSIVILFRLFLISLCEVISTLFLYYDQYRSQKDLSVVIDQYSRKNIKMLSCKCTF